VLNLSTVNFNEKEINLLNKGPKFCLPDNNFEGDQKYSLIQFVRSIKLRNYFFKNDYTSKDCFLPVKNSKFYPEYKDTVETNDICKLINNDFCSISNNLNTESFYKSAFRSLKMKFFRNRLKIVKADKGSILVIITIDDYHKLVDTHLKDGEFYKKVYVKDIELDRIILNKIATLFRGFENLFDARELNYLCNRESKFSYFYVLPKLHKEEKIVNKITAQKDKSIVKIKFDDVNLESRPIIASKNCVTSGISFFVHFILQQFFPFVKSYTKDTFHLINFVKNSSCNNFQFFVSIDVKSLYTNIDNRIGLDAISFFLDKFYSRVKFNQYPKDLLINLLSVIINNNFFTYRGSSYKQLKGCAMGSICSPTYAILVLGFFEINLYDSCCCKFGKEKAEIIFDNFHRYIDDILIFWYLSEDEFHLFIELMKAAYQKLKFIFNINSQTINFLDVTIAKHNNCFSTDIYRKPTDNFCYVPFNSHHPSHVKRNIPYNLFRRISSIVSCPSQKSFRFNEIKLELINLGYPVKLLNDAICKATNEIHTVQQKEKPKDFITFVIKYNKCNLQTVDLVRNYFNLLLLNDSTKKMFDDHKLLVSYYNNSSLIKSINQPIFKVAKCNISRCKTCDLLITGTFHKHENKFILKPNSIINCRSKNLIYYLKCFYCNEFYIGETECEFRFRVTLHRQHAETNYGRCKLSNHLKACAKERNGTPRFLFFPFYLNERMTTRTRREIEEFFIAKYDPNLNSK